MPQAIGDAVLVALESDPANRFAAAGELADALRRGLAGISPEPTAATRVLGGGEPTGATRQMPPTQTRRQPPRRRPPVAPPPQPRQKRDAAGAARTALALIAVLLLAAAVAAIVTLTTTSSLGDRVNLEDVVKDNLQEQVDSLRDVIEDNKK